MSPHSRAHRPSYIRCNFTVACCTPLREFSMHSAMKYLFQTSFVVERGQTCVLLLKMLVFWVTKTNNGSPCATGPLSCLSVLSVCPVCNVGVCGQTVGWIKMPLGIQRYASPRHIVLDGTQLPPHGKGHSSRQRFGRCLLWPNGCPAQQLLSSCLLW